MRAKTLISTRKVHRAQLCNANNFATRSAAARRKVALRALFGCLAFVNRSQKGSRDCAGGKGAAEVVEVCSLGTMASSQAYELMSPSQPVRVPPFALNYLITGDFMFPYAYAHNCDRVQVPHTSFSRECESCAAGGVQSQETAAVHLFGPHVATTTQHMYYHRQRHIFVLLEMRRRATAERKRPSSTHTHTQTLTRKFRRCL